MLYSFSPTLITIYLPWSWHVLTMLYDIIVSRTFYIVPLCHMSVWLMWMWQVTSCFVFFTYVQIKKKKLENKIKENKRQRKEKNNRIKPSSLFTTLTRRAFEYLDSSIKKSCYYYYLSDAVYTRRRKLMGLA